MGSFDVTCCISDLTIGVGDKVRVLLLTENPYEESTNACTLTDMWFPRTFPVEAVYDDYGRANEAKPKFMTDLWQEGFKRDLVVRGWGDNLCHDVPTSKTMDYEYTMDACYEGRIKVLRDTGSGLGNHTKIPNGVPTRKRIEKILTANDMPVSSKGMGQKGYVVNGVRYGEVRIRWEGSGDTWGQDEKFLTNIQPFLNEYAAMVRAGKSGTRAEMVVCVKPGNEEFYGYSKKRSDKPLLVKSAMIREDVWQGLCDQGMELDYGKKRASRDDIIKMGHDHWEECLKRADNYKTLWSKIGKDISGKDEDAVDQLGHTLYLMANRDNPHGYMISKDTIPYVIALGTHYAIFLDKAINKKVSKDEIDYFIQATSEFMIVMSNLHYIRYWWRPTYSAGPQWGEWTKHERTLKLFHDIAKKQAVKYKRLYEED